ncbi:tetratricopeptide repeat protein 14-like isoform X2 [Paramacrobiotus metropolitanus]|uniref:tetratricopeptide repeat protein 14-like isoform X2 n=1 Tax=Paramacrobiotus metropolitanus TaxID=2943436 RepID=UPI002445FADE|nr:tetratricopeptide repeat protein 14-like isoform X2 [Paramacrobiotus metropolitanus]
MRRTTCQEIDNLAERKSDVLRMFSKWAVREPLSAKTPDGDKSKLDSESDLEACCPVIPPLEHFLDMPTESMRTSLLSKFFLDIRKGDIVYGSVSTKLVSGLSLKLLACEWSQMARPVADLGIKAFCPSVCIPALNPRQDPVDTYEARDYVRAVITDINPEHEKIVVSVLPADLPKSEKMCSLGRVSFDELPRYYRHLLDKPPSRRDDVASYIRNQREFENPAFLELMRGHLNISESESSSRWYSLVPGYCGKHVPIEEKGEQLTKVQSQRWSMKSVEEGIKFMKDGDLPRSAEALSKAVDMDKSNVEALVARGALHTKKEDYHRAIKDFEEALRLKPSHRNAKKYLADTFFALGKKFEKDEPKRAVKCYRDALRWDPRFEEALEAKDALMQRDQKPTVKEIPSYNTSSTAEKLRKLLHSESTESTRALSRCWPHRLLQYTRQTEAVT